MKEYESQAAQQHRKEQAAQYFNGFLTAFVLGMVIVAGHSWYVLRASGCAAEPLAAERINPNTAPPASLMRLPGIGKVRAMDILACRQASSEGLAVFRSPADLEQVRGIGPKTVEKMEPYLTFETNENTNNQTQ